MGIDREERRKHKWIFQILAGKHPNETIVAESRDKYRLREVNEFYRRIKKLIIEEGLDKEQVEKILTTNYYIGMRVYCYIMNHFVKSSSITIHVCRYDKPRIRATTTLGKIFILIPNLYDEDFD